MKLNIVVAFAALTFGTPLVFAGPIDTGIQYLATREAYGIDGFMARNFADVDARQFEGREDGLLEDIFARRVGSDPKLLLCISSMLAIVSHRAMMEWKPLSYTVAVRTVTERERKRKCLMPPSHPVNPPS
jgi:hypothetical protein